MEFIGTDECRAVWNQHFIQVKSNIKQPKRTKTARIETNKGGTYSYSYADLADVDKAVMDACRTVKDKDGNAVFGYYFDIDNSQEGVSVQTVMVDSAGGSMISDKIWFRNNYTSDAQRTASLISYAKRYSLSGAFGIASEDDDDAQNLKADKPTVRILDEKELDSYEVVAYGHRHLLKDIWNDYIENHDQETKHWLTTQRDPQTKQAIKQLLDNYNINQKINAIMVEKDNSKPEPPAKKVQKPERMHNDSTGGDEIKQLVDGDKQDKVSESTLADDALNLFWGEK